MCYQQSSPPSVFLRIVVDATSRIIVQILKAFDISAIFEEESSPPTD
jgi:hypothetical protein